MELTAEDDKNAYKKPQISVLRVFAMLLHPVKRSRPMVPPQTTRNILIVCMYIFGSTAHIVTASNLGYLHNYL